MSKNSCKAAESIEDAVHDNRMFAERAFYCIANGAGNCTVLHPAYFFTFSPTPSADNAYRTPYTP